MGGATLEGRHALVGGGSQGIGRATALALAERKAAVTVMARSAEALEGLLPELRERGAPEARALVADLDDRAGLRERVGALLAERPVQILIHNTGGPAPGPLLDATEEAFLEAFGRHVLAGQLLVQSVLPGMREAGYGRIVNVVSTSVREPIPNLGVSNTIRGAVASWAKTLSRELPAGITINSVLPGFTDTERLSGLANSLASKRGVEPERVREDWIDQVPEGRLGRPEELGEVVAFLTSPAAAYVRGVCLPVDGGRLRGI